MKSDVKFYEVFREEEEALRRFLPPEVRADFTARTIQAGGDAEPPARLICIRTQSLIPAPWAQKIRGVLTRSTGYDHLLDYLRRVDRKIACGYLGGYCSRAVAEHAVMLLLALWKKFPQQIRQFAAFDRDGLTGQEAAGKNLLVVGVGRIGSEIAGLARALGMHVKGVDPVRNKDLGLEYISLDEGAAWADAVVCAAALTAETRGMIGAGVFRKASRPLIFVNVSRGEISPAADISAALDEGLLSGAGMDVFEEEAALAGHLRGEPAVEHPAVEALRQLAAHPNVVMTPHNAFNTVEALERKAALTADAVAHFLRDGHFPKEVAFSADQA